MPTTDAPSVYRSVGEAIARLRKRRKPRMTQLQLAKAAEVSRASIANIEQGRHRIQLHVLYDIADALEVEPHDLLPHLNSRSLKQPLPEDISKKLRTPREAHAISRLLESGKDETHEES